MSSMAAVGEPVLLQQRVAVSVDWDAAPTGDSTGYMIVETVVTAWRLAVPAQARPRRCPRFLSSLSRLAKTGGGVVLSVVSLFG